MLGVSNDVLQPTYVYISIERFLGRNHVHRRRKTGGDLRLGVKHVVGVLCKLFLPRQRKIEIFTAFVEGVLAYAPLSTPMMRSSLWPL
jgi:hypothetical protein